MVKKEKYEILLSQAEALIDHNVDLIANMSNIAALLHETFHFWWTGFYRIMPIGGSQSEQLVLGPFQGPIACTRIGFGKGVCGTSWQRMQTVIVPDVEQFKGHIACSSESRSEIVVPIIREGRVVAVLDVDSRELNTFDETDRLYMERIVAML